MKCRKFYIERYIIEEGDYEEQKHFRNNDKFDYTGDTFYGEPVFETITNTETVIIDVP